VNRVLKLLCPHCLKSVSLPDDAAGKDAPCPECGQSFPIPARYNPTVSAGAAPIIPPPVPSIASEPLPNHPLPIPSLEAVPAASMPLPAGYTHSLGFAISPVVVAWIPSVGLTLILLLTLMPWVGVFPGGHAVYTQGAWRALTGWPQRDIQVEEWKLSDLPPPSVYERTHSDWLIMLPYLMALLVAVILAWTERLEYSQFATGIPRRLPLLWPYRDMMLAAFAACALLLLSVEALRGFGLERAMAAAVNEKFDDQRKAAGSETDKLVKIAYNQQLDMAKYRIELTGWFYLVMCLHILVVLAMLGRVGLERRGNKPPPRLVIQY
jgi:hypothetical protein